MKYIKPRLLVLSAVWPFPGHSGQQQRVYYKLKAFRERFHVTFLTFAPASDQVSVREQLLTLCDEALVLPSHYLRGTASRVLHRLRGGLHTLRTGLKFSNYVIQEVEFPPERIRRVLQEHNFDCAVFEYWHAVNSAEVLQQAGIPCVLDMHNILWQSYQRQLAAKKWLPNYFRRYAMRQYRAREEAAWDQFDALITINAAEHAYVEKLIPAKRSFYAPMGIDLKKWPYSWQPATPPRVAYYGGLGSLHNQRDALRCYHDIMPGIWEQYPNVELWLVGSNPPPEIMTVAETDGRVHVTGFVTEIQELLQTMTAVLCPWHGRYGFRSRLIEVMALGVPVVASPDAVYGMKLEDRQGLFLSDKDDEMKQVTLDLICDAQFAEKQSKLAHQQVKQQYSYRATYTRLASQLEEFVNTFPTNRGIFHTDFPS